MQKYRTYKMGNKFYLNKVIHLDLPKTSFFKVLRVWLIIMIKRHILIRIICLVLIFELCNARNNVT